MLRQERYEDPNNALLESLQGWQATMWTMLPGIIESVDFEKNTCEVQPTTQGIFRKKDGTEETVTMPMCLDVPILWPRAGGYALTFPVKKGDEGIIVFASRCYDAFWQNGGVQPQAELRMHDLSDGMFIPANISQPKKLEEVSEDSVELRSDNGERKARITEDSVEVLVKDDTSVIVKDKEIHFKAGNATIDMTDTKIELNADTVEINGIVWDTHKHTGVQAGGGTSGGPTN